MKQIYSDVLQWRGTHYDFGIMQGELLKDSFTLRNRQNQWKIRKPRFVIWESEVKEAILPFASHIWDELCGLRDALDWPMNDVLLEFGGYRLEYMPSGCSIYMNPDYMIRNYDYHPKTYEGRYTVFQPTDAGYAVIGPSQRITGRMDGMNEKGLVMGYNFTHRKKPGDGFICSMIGRLVLESCGDVQEAIALLQDIPHRHSFSYVILDATGDSAIVEATPREVSIRHANVCTNHFENMRHENRHHLDDSYARIRAIHKGSHSIHQMYDAFRMFNDTDRGVFSDKYKNWAGTIHTSAYLPKTRKAWFALGGNREPFIFDFDKWLKGNDFTASRVLGEVDTEMPFAHMDPHSKK
ncbi:MAG TPA: C45 family peptidase [Virgibacillus sp.]|nr:C45 family peptidase [Virgibacillus sp.]